MEKITLRLHLGPNAKEAADRIDGMHLNEDERHAWGVSDRGEFCITVSPARAMELLEDMKDEGWFD